MFIFKNYELNDGLEKGLKNIHIYVIALCSFIFRILIRMVFFDEFLNCYKQIRWVPAYLFLKCVPKYWRNFFYAFLRWNKNLRKTLYNFWHFNFHRWRRRRFWFFFFHSIHSSIKYSGITATFESYFGKISVGSWFTNGWRHWSCIHRHDDNGNNLISRKICIIFSVFTKKNLMICLIYTFLLFSFLYNGFLLV